MTELGRREFLVGAAAAAMAASTPAAGQQPKRGGTLRYIPISDLKVIDPIWTTAYVVRDHGYMVYDTLFALDENLQVQPQMVDKWTASRDQMKWTFTLRDGLEFHDGQPVTAEDCVASLQRWGKRDPLGKLLMAATGRLQALDKKTLVLELKEPFGLVLDALGKPSSNVPFIMPARVAATSENEQIKETIGSGPFRFVKEEWRPGHQVVYERFDKYVPRSEPPSGAAGGKRVYLDRVIWRYIPDAATIRAALEAGEIDFWSFPPIDFVAQLERNPNVTTFVNDPVGLVGWMRPNHLHPPFNDKRARQALLHAMDQSLFLQAAVGQPKYYRPCWGIFGCGAPYETAVGAPPKPDVGRAKQLMKEAGYDGRPVVVLDPTDRTELHAAALMSRELLTRIGVNVDLQAIDWSTLVARRAKKDPPAQGGWNMFSTNWIVADVMTPAVNAGIGGACDKAWFGWYCSEQMEKMRAEWARTTDAAKRKQLAEQIQLLAFDEVPFVPWGQYLQPQLFAKKVKGVLKFLTPVVWNVWLEG
jgi:peptide/nickel transport system substrate-binding protein